MAKAKNDTDKDLLFSKILPALNDNPYSSTYQASEVQHEFSKIPIPTTENDDAISALREKMFSRSNNHIGDAYATINVMENLVLQHINKVMQRFNVCGCDRCRCDVAAYALNHLPAKYIVAEPMRMAEATEAVTIKIVMDALVNAVIQVRSVPRH